MNQMERIAKMIVSEPDPNKRQMMKDEIDKIFYLTHHYGKVSRTQLSKRLGIPKLQLNQLIIENDIKIEPVKISKSEQNRRACLKRLESVK